MTKIQSAAESEAIVGVLDKVKARKVHAPIKTALPTGKVAALLASLEHDFTAESAPLIHFTSAYAGQGSNRIAFEMAYYAATQDHKRVLFLDNDENTGEISEPFRKSRDITLDEFVKSAAGGELSPFLVEEGTSFYYASFSKTNARQNLPLNAHLRKRLFEKLRTMFDLIVLPSQSALTAGSASAFSAIADGTIIVVEAERTRVPVLNEVKQRIEASGGRVAGTVMNRRQRYIPAFLYHLLFKSGGKDA